MNTAASREQQLHGIQRGIRRLNPNPLLSTQINSYVYQAFALSKQSSRALTIKENHTIMRVTSVTVKSISKKMERIVTNEWVKEYWKWSK
ncbi:hypothetical protein QJS10_CPA07g00746 [Acorus calamus]|uniref:Uncharacterized protein n=1 Tax=Acorus calamus TaxID=4465 RepID=A0AAV9EFS3_ACOCL|nr:hypothetical protein QJS10_CPA07g00746 [Acorus calamus]